MGLQVDSKDKFKFEYCANHYDGCANAPNIRISNKEYCLECYAKEIYRDLEFAIKYGKHKDFYKKIDRWSTYRPSGAFKKRK